MQFGLFGGGAVSASMLAGLPRLAERLGPVAAANYRLASRIVNSLRAGYPVKSPDDLQTCALVLVRVPARTVDAAVKTLARTAVSWRNKTVLLCETGLDSSVLESLQARGAAVGSVTPIPGCPGCYVVEGDRAPARRQAKSLVRALGGRSVVLDRAHLALYEAGLALATDLFTPLMAATEECLAAAGSNAHMAARVTAALFHKTMRNWHSHGRSSWSGPLALGDEAALKRQLQALERSNPVLARYYRDAAAFALEYFGRHADLHRWL